MIDRDNEVFNAFKAVLALPFEELMTAKGIARPSRCMQMLVFLDVFNAMSQCSRPLEGIIIDDERVS
jgi:hypothetical protein